MSFKSLLRISAYILGTYFLCSCNSSGNGSKLPRIEPDIISEQTPFDTDDPAIWVHPTNPSQSIVFGTDKDTKGGIYAFDLKGKMIKEKSITGIQRPNNVDLEYGFPLNDSISTDIIVFTEREKQQVRVFSVPDMKPIDNGGFPVFTDEKDINLRLPMGVAIYKSPKDNSFYVIVSRKSGPSNKYLYQYRLSMLNGQFKHTLVRKFGQFSGKKEIEAIAVDSETGFVYYSDEGHCIRKYYAEPNLGNQEISCFGGDKFKEDIEGIAIVKKANLSGYLIVSDQQKGQFNLFDRQTNEFIKAVNLSTTETDGCDVISVPLNKMFGSGLFVAMNDNRNFFFYDLDKVLD